MKLGDQFSPKSNVTVCAYEKGKLIATRKSHNVFTNIGRSWIKSLVGAASYANIQGNGYIEGTNNVLTSERVAYMGFGVGGALQTNALYFRTQEELVTVTAIEDFVFVDPINYLAQVTPQSIAAQSFPTNYSIKFSVTLPESSISFSANTSKSGEAVGLDVPISEAGLYISGADPTIRPDEAPNSTRLIAYNIFSPIHKTNNIVIKIEWEFRF